MKWILKIRQYAWKFHASEETVEIFVEADFEADAEERRRFALINIPRHLSVRRRLMPHDARRR
jgi:hypothetical protein